MRINKYLSECGICSRRKADELVAQGKVYINGAMAEAGSRVEPENDEVICCGKPAVLVKEKTYLAFYKPIGIVCTAHKGEKDNVIDFLNFEKRLTYAGRLDKDSEGLLIMTDDGDFIDSLMHSRNMHEKEYVVRTEFPITHEQIVRLREGVYLEELDVTTRKCRVFKSSPSEFHIVLTQGLNRQIRRMCEAVGVKIVNLKRVRIANVMLGELQPGEYRELTKEEVKGTLYG